VTQGGTTPILH